MGQGNLAGARIAASTDQSGIGDGVMRGTERSLLEQGMIVRKQSGHRMDLGGLKGFFKGEIGQDGRQTPGQHGFAAAGRTAHQNIVRCGRSNFQRPLDMLLTAHL